MFEQIGQEGFRVVGGTTGMDVDAMVLSFLGVFGCGGRKRGIQPGPLPALSLNSESLFTRPSARLSSTSRRHAQSRNRRTAQCRKIDTLQCCNPHPQGGGCELSVLHHRPECRDRERAGPTSGCAFKNLRLPQTRAHGHRVRRYRRAGQRGFRRCRARQPVPREHP